jgi:acyl-CoA thioester hydrolase
MTNIDSDGSVTFIRVRYADTDQMKVAYNGAYFTWFEIGRTEMIRNTGLTYGDIENTGILLPVIEAGVKYLKPARYDDVLSIRTTIESQKGVRIRFRYEIFRDNELLASGFTEHVFSNADLKPVRPPGQLADLTALIK